MLEQRGVAEAQAGHPTRGAGWPELRRTQRQNAVAAQTAFNNVRWGFLSYRRQKHGRAAIDEDDEVKQTWNGNYYNARGKHVHCHSRFGLSPHAHLTLIWRLQGCNAIYPANAYKGIAQAQIGQAPGAKPLPSSA